MAKKKDTTIDNIHEAEAEHAIKNYTRVPNMLVDGYPSLHPQDKWLFVCLVRLCGKEGTRHLSLRYISDKTGFSRGVLADNKKDNKPGMIRRLHNAGLIHAEIKRKKNKDGQEEKNAQYHITITDTWALNYTFFNETRPESGQDANDKSKLVQNQDATCPESGQDAHEGVQNQDETCPDSGPNVRLQDKITNNKITEGKNESSESPNALPSSTPSLFSFSLEDVPLQDLYARINQLEQQGKELEHLSTSDVHNPTQDVENKQAVIEPYEHHIATTTTPNSPPSQRNTEPLLSEAGRQVREYWYEMGYETTSASNGYWNSLSKHIQSFEQFKSLYEHTRSKLVDAKDPTVHPGNLVKCVNGWKQKQAPLPEPAKPQVNSHKRVRTNEEVASLPL